MSNFEGDWEHLATSGSAMAAESPKELDDINHELTEIANRAIHEESLGEDYERKIMLEARRKELEGKN